jgi:hypothetical protein
VSASSPEPGIPRHEEIHRISSHIRQPGNSYSVFRGKRHQRVEYDRYLVGRSYRLFRQAIKTAQTLKNYNRNLCYFRKFVGMSTEDLVKAHEPFIVVDDKKTPNFGWGGQQALQMKIENYVLALQERVNRGEIEPATCVVSLPPP